VTNINLNDALKYSIILFGLAGGYYGLDNLTKQTAKTALKLETKMDKAFARDQAFDRKQLQQGSAIETIVTSIKQINQSIDKKAANRWSAKDAKYKHQQQDFIINRLSKKIEHIEGRYFKGAPPD
jgi:hypothetical protein